MVSQVTIVFLLPADIGEKYSNQFLTDHFEGLLDTTLELPHPDYSGADFTAQIVDAVIE